jgi:hypothetical protein
MAITNQAMMGFEKVLYIGTAGTTAATQVLDIVNLKVTETVEYGNTISRGDGLVLPRVSKRAVSLDKVVTFNSLNVPDNSNLVTLKAAATSETPASRVIALKVVDVASGVTEFDADVDLSIDRDAQLSAEQDHAYVATVDRSHRNPAV